MLGGLFLWHGVDKFDTGISMVEGAFEGWGVPAPGLTAPLTAIVEVVAGAALVLGIGTRIGAALVALIVIGPGRISPDQQLDIEPREASDPREPALD